MCCVCGMCDVNDALGLQGVNSMMRLNFSMSICDNLSCKNISSYTYNSSFDNVVKINSNLCRECAIIMQNFQLAEHEIV